MIYLGKNLFKSLFFGKNVIKRIFFGKTQVYPSSPIPPTPVITSYTISDIYIHMSSGDKIKVNGSNYAYITATVTELHDGAVYRSFTETATTLSFRDTRFIQRGGNIYYNVDSQWREIETIYQRVNVDFTMYGITKTTNIPVEANEAVTEYLTVLVADSSPADIINANGEDVYIYAEFENTKRTTYTSGYIDDDYQGRVPGYVNIYIKYNDSYWVLRKSHIETSTSGQYTSIENVPANLYEPQAVYFKIEDASGQSPDVILNFTQDAVQKYNVIWDIHNIDYQNVSLAYDEYEPLPEAVPIGSSLLFYIKNIEDCDVLVRENGQNKAFLQEWDEDYTTMSVRIDNIQGNLSITLFGIQ